ncbi:ribonuclease Z, mitochondrial [Condylostylus longicornis]|uniref:ribonuclease Z, mitochondrial n=1 Tax=Condylostylus longicornis TaxID=2530218 RepID=UPI00244E3978|nr:ribonuclease Z, mitochondrial [Condylostylus longicornis]
MFRNIKIALQTSIPLNVNKFRVSTLSNSKLKLNKLLISMPKEREHIAEAQKQRQKIKEKSSKYIPGTVNLQVLGNGSSSAPAVVYLFTDQNRYLFNCGEGTQRLAHEHKTKLSRLEHIFMTRTSWDRLGGLPGLTLTVQDSGVPNLTLHGPPGLDEIFRGMERFVVLKDLKVSTVNYENGGDFEDQVMTVKCIPLKIDKYENNNDAKSSDLKEEIPEIDDTDYYEYENKKKDERQSPISINVKNISSENYQRREEFMTCAYICKLKPKPGSLNLEKCVDKGVPPGPLLGQLKNGFDVELPDGTIVKSDDVRAPTDPGPVFIFIDVPNEDYLVALEKQANCFEDYQAKSENEDNKAILIIHFTPQNIIQTEAYKKFMMKFPNTTQHLILNSSNRFSGYVATHRIQYQLNQIHSGIFPLLKESIDLNIDQLERPTKKLKLLPDNINSQIKIIEKENSLNCIPDVITLTSFNLRPKKSLDRSYEPQFTPDEYIEETHAVEGFLESLHNFKNIYNKINSEENDDSITKLNYPKILFLGTGSCIPNKTRNVSSILLNINSSSCILFDCGEGTWGQIIRFYGENEALEILHNLKAIFVSHLHADHHIGLIGLLKARQLLKIETPILLFAPAQIKNWLNFYDRRIEKLSTEYSLIPNADLITTPYNTLYTEEMGIKSISTCLVRHCPHAFGIAIELIEEFNMKPIKITYSGDTMPCDELIKLGMNSTILIHEATMEDELQHEAIYKMHSTVSQAISQGERMQSQYTILTHFSQRYAKLPRIENDIGQKVGLAFDNMEICLKDIKYLPLMYPTLKIMFTEHCEELEQKAVKRALKKERKRQSIPENKNFKEITR